MRDVDRDKAHYGRDAKLHSLDVHRVGLQLRDEDVHALGELCGVGVRPAIAGPDERQAVPVETIGRRAVFAVRATPVTDDDTVLVVADSVAVAEIELVDFHLVTVPDRKLVEAVRVPVGHRLHALDHGLGAILGRATRWAGDPQRLPAPHPGREAVDVRELAVVIDVQMGDEDVVDHLQGHLQRDDVAQAARAEIEEEPLTVAELHHDRGASLRARRRHGRAADEGDAHLIRAQLLNAREKGVGVGDRGRRPVIGRQGDAGVRPAAIRVLRLAGRRRWSRLLRRLRGVPYAHGHGRRRRRRSRSDRTPEHAAPVHGRPNRLICVLG